MRSFMPPAPRSSARSISRPFYNPATGVLAGWRSADGKLHDYYFLFVNGVAIVYGLVPPDKANRIMDRLLAKMKEVGYTHFEYGLPGNLVPVRREDYAHHILSSGGGVKEDGSDGFQIYQNGGATASFAYFTLQALYQLGRREEADAILFPLLAGFEKGGSRDSAPTARPTIGKPGTARRMATRACWWIITRRCWRCYRADSMRANVRPCVQEYRVTGIPTAIGLEGAS